MKRVLKYELNIGHTTMYLPKGYKILKIGVQESYNPKLWALVDDDPDIEQERIEIICYATGDKLFESNIEYLDTVFLNNKLVFHFFKIL